MVRSGSHPCVLAETFVRLFHGIVVVGPTMSKTQMLKLCPEMQFKCYLT